MSSPSEDSFFTEQEKLCTWNGQETPITPLTAIFLPVPLLDKKNHAAMTGKQAPERRAEIEHAAGGLLPGWPPKRPAAEQVIVQVPYALASIGATVDDDTISAGGDPEIGRQLCGGNKNFAHHRGIARRKSRDARDVFARYDQDVDRRLWANVFESYHRVVPIDDLAFDISFDDAAKKAIAHRSSNSGC
jgi:hypothetical protein